MVYCNLKQINNDSAVYFVGTTTDDITGEVEFYKDFKNPHIIKQPQTGNVYISLLSHLAVKYKNIFSKGEFPNKISYEI